MHTIRQTILLVLIFAFTAPAFSADKESSAEPKPKKKWSEYFNWGRRGADKSADADSEANPEGMVDLVDSPTPNIVDYGAYRLNFRLYSEGGVQGHMSFGVFRRLNVGASWDIEKAIGSQDTASNTPALFVKFRVYDGGQVLPAVALGFDGQGRFFDRSRDEYRETERGLFLVLNRELFFPNLELNGSANIAKFKDGTVFGSVGLSYTIEQKVAVLMEYDNIRSAPGNRWNTGLRFFPTPSLAIDFAFRNLCRGQEGERIVRVNYVGSF